MSNYISYIGPYIKFQLEDEEFLDNNASDNYFEVGYTHNNYRYLISSDEFSISEVDIMLEKEITPEEINSSVARFKKLSEKFVENFKESFDTDLVVLYGTIFYEA